MTHRSSTKSNGRKPARQHSGPLALCRDKPPAALKVSAETYRCVMIDVKFNFQGSGVDVHWLERDTRKGRRRKGCFQGALNILTSYTYIQGSHRGVIVVPVASCTWTAHQTSSLR